MLAVMIFNAVLLLGFVLQTAQDQATDVNICERNIRIRKKIQLYHDINDLDPPFEDVTCQCDLYTPPYRGCVSLKAQSVEALDLMSHCQVQQGRLFDTENNSCVIQYRVNELYSGCPHNITVVMVPRRSLHEPVKMWLNVSARDRSGVYVSCKWTGYPPSQTYSSEASTVQNIVHESEVTTVDEQNTTLSSACPNCTTYAPPNKKPNSVLTYADVADQVEIVLATAAGFVGAFLVISLICACSSGKVKQEIAETPPRRRGRQMKPSVKVEVASTSDSYDNVFIESDHTETKSKISVNSRKRPESPKVNSHARSHSDTCYDNVAFNV